jgi:aminopeptidase-like protein/aminoglycoside N3'-acetyltransferase
MSSSWHYNKKMMVDTLYSIGIQKGDIISLQVSLGRLGFVEEGKTIDVAAKVLIDAFLEVLSKKGTLLVPTYTYSIGKGEIFDVQNTPSAIGEFTEIFRNQPNVFRSADPMLSTAGIGPQAKELLTDLSHSCYGEGSLFHKLQLAGAKICTLGVSLYYATFRHHIEEFAKVPFRFKKLFTGFVKNRDLIRHEAWEYFAAILIDNCAPFGLPLEKLAHKAGLVKVASIGRGEIMIIEAQEYYEFGLKEFQKNPWLTAKGPPCSMKELIHLEDKRVSGPKYQVKLSPQATMSEMIEAIWRLPRDLVSEGYDAALNALAMQVPMTIHEYPTGTECWTWIVPEKWTCLEAHVETLDGKRVFSYSDHPLHVAAYSHPFEGVVSREELLKHLTVHPTLRDAIPFHYLFYNRDWGLCCSQDTKESLTDEQYRVLIKTEFSYSTLKVLEIIVKGQTEDSIVLCAHLDHTAQVNDGLSGVVVGIDVMRELIKRKDLRYTHRLIIVPETIGSLAYLSQNEHLIPTMKGGIFLDMLALKYPHSLQLSYSGDSEFDRCCFLALKEMDPLGRTGKFLEVVTNDERQFNAPGLRIPMVSLSRVQNHCGKQGVPSFPEYHSSLDSDQLVSTAKLEESRDLVLRMIDIWEKNIIPKNKFMGEVFLSRFGINFDFKIDPDYGQTLFEVMHSIDGTSSLAEIALKFGRKFSTVYHIVEEFKKKGLIK